jgi:hypothetical protein
MTALALIVSFALLVALRAATAQQPTQVHYIGWPSAGSPPTRSFDQSDLNFCRFCSPVSGG